MTYGFSQNSKLLPMVLILSGIFIGFANGFFGGGGGMLAVPALTLFLALEEKEAHATAICVILPLSIASAIVYLVSGGFNISVGLPTTAGVIIGGILGSFALKKIANKPLAVIFYTLTIIVGIRLIF